MSKEQDREFFRNYSLIIGVLAVMIVIFLFLARHFGVDQEAEARHRAPMVAEATQPVGQVNTDAAAAAQAAAPAAADTGTAPAAAADDHPGAKAYGGLCFSCHGTGVPGSPQLGDKAMWEPRIAKGVDALYTNAINGLTSDAGFMPPKGGNPALSDDEVKAAVDYMVSKIQ